MSELLLLAIETSCDETAAAVVKNGRTVLSNIIASQIELHKKYGGVVPEIASRKHVETIGPVVEQALSVAKVSLSDLDAVAVTNGPGLVGALLVGLSYGKALAYAIRKPLVGVHHIEGHICANYIENDFEPPMLCLVVSGGHTFIVYVKDYGCYEVLGQTRDDAAGEAYDKIARVLGLAYPGGPIIDQLAESGDTEVIRFPRAVVSDGPLDFSFSGLKSAVINYVNKCRACGVAYSIENVAASFQQAVVDVLVDKTMKAAMETGVQKVAISGGVSANRGLRTAMLSACHERGLLLNMPPLAYCTDNAVMIGTCGYYNILRGKISSMDLNAHPDLALV